MELSTLVKMSNTYGSNPAYVLAGGGNTSVKDDTTLYVKGSGTQLATIKAEEFVKMDRARLNEIMKTEYPADDVKRESAYLADVMAAVTDEDKTKRPSVEALLHNLFAYTYVLHVHPTLINGLTCGKGAKALCEELLGKDVLWIDICKPGYTLARICFEKMNAYKEETGKDVQVLLLQNHGIFVAADTVEEIGVLFDGVIGKLEKQVKRIADVSDAVTPEKEQAAQKLSSLLGHAVEVVPAAEADHFVKDKAAADVVNVTGVKEDNSIVIGGLEYGYYVVDEVSDVEGTHSAASMCIVNTANPKADVNIKSDYPTVIKKIQEDDNKENIGNDGWNDIGDFEIGQTVPYKFESNIPNINGYDTYYYAWHDVMDEALTFDPDSVAIHVRTEDKNYELAKDEFQVITNPGNGETFKVEIQDIKAIVDREFDQKNDLNENVYGQKVILRYNATLNDKAAEDTGRPGFENDVRLEFSNNPDHDGDGTTGYTPWDTVVCFTYKLNILKTNDHDLKLEGAKFRLYSDKELKNEVYVKKAEDDGYIVINRDTVGGSDHIGGTTPQDSVEMVSNAKREIKIYGLDTDIYYLKETEAPAGYRPLLDPIVLNLKATFTDERNDYVKGDGATDKTLQKLETTAHIKEFFDGAYKESDVDLTTDTSEGSSNLTVINKVGKKLPVTGSSMMLLMLTAGTALVTGAFVYGKRQKKSNDEN